MYLFKVVFYRFVVSVKTYSIIRNFSFVFMSEVDGINVESVNEIQTVFNPEIYQMLQLKLTGFSETYSYNSELSLFVYSSSKSHRRIY